NRIGFDVLNIRLVEEKDGKLTAHTERFLDRLGRPIDLCVSGGKLYVVEYCRQNETAGSGSAGYGVGGRVLEVAGRKDSELYMRSAVLGVLFLARTVAGPAGREAAAHGRAVQCFQSEDG